MIFFCNTVPDMIFVNLIIAITAIQSHNQSRICKRGRIFIRHTAAKHIESRRKSRHRQQNSTAYHSKNRNNIRHNKPCPNQPYMHRANRADIRHPRGYFIMLRMRSGTSRSAQSFLQASCSCGESTSTMLKMTCGTYRLALTAKSSIASKPSSPYRQLH